MGQGCALRVRLSVPPDAYFREVSYVRPPYPLIPPFPAEDATEEGEMISPLTFLDLLATLGRVLFALSLSLGVILGLLLASPAPALGGDSSLLIPSFLAEDAQKLTVVRNLIGRGFFEGEARRYLVDRDFLSYFPGFRFYYHQLTFARNSYAFVAIPVSGGRAYVLGGRRMGVELDTQGEWGRFMADEVREILSPSHALAIGKLYALATSERDLPLIVEKPGDIPQEVLEALSSQDREVFLKPPHVISHGGGEYTVSFTAYERYGHYVSRWFITMKAAQFEGWAKGYAHTKKALL